MTETRASYLSRLLPDLILIRGDIEDGASSDKSISDFAMVNVIARVEKLLEDLERAYNADR